MVPDLSQYRLLTEAETAESLREALRVNIRCLPQLKGKGAVRDDDAISGALALLANEVARQILSQNAVMLVGPPVKPHSTPLRARIGRGASFAPLDGFRPRHFARQTSSSSTGGR